MPRAPKGAAAPPPEAAGEEPWSDAVPAIDLTNGATLDESRIAAEAQAAADRDTDGDKSNPDTADIEFSGDISTGDDEVVVIDGIRTVGVTEEMIAADPVPAKKAAPAKKAPAKRARPTPVTGTPDPSLPGGSEVKAVLEFGALAEEEDFVNCLWYGPEGVGKTTAALRAAERGRVLVVNAEGGLKKRALAAQGIPVENIVIWPPAGHEDQLTQTGLQELGYKIRQDLRDDPKSWYAVVWDSGSAIAERLLRLVVRTEVAKNAALPEHKQKASRADEFFTDLSDYGTVTAQVIPLVQQYRDLQCHFLVTALERRDVDEDTGQVMYGPTFTPAISGGVRADMDMVIRVGQRDVDGEQVIVGLTRPNERYRGKDRFGVTPNRLADPSFTRVLGYIEGELTENDDPIQKTLPPANAGGRRNKEA